MKLTLAIAVSLILSTQSYADRERNHQKEWCPHGKLEHVLSDRTRIDCLTETHAIEFDHARKWAEAIGQSLYYSAKTGKEAGIVLIMHSGKDYRYVERLQHTIDSKNLEIDVWLMKEYE